MGGGGAPRQWESSGAGTILDAFRQLGESQEGASLAGGAGGWSPTCSAKYLCRQRQLIASLPARYQHLPSFARA